MHVTRLCSDAKAVVSGQAVAALAAVCREHEGNAREAARCKAPKVAMELLYNVIDDDVRIANLVQALLCMAQALADNIQVVLRCTAMDGCRVVT